MRTRFLKVSGSAIAACCVLALLLAFPSCAKKAAQADPSPAATVEPIAPSSEPVLSNAEPSPAVSAQVNKPDAVLTTTAPVKKANGPTGTVVVSGLGFYDFNKIQFAPMDSYANYVAWMKANTKDSEKYLKQRWDRMAVDNVWHPENSQALRKAFLAAPREYFARSYNSEHVYAHAAWPIEDGQTIPGPHLVTRMTHNIEPRPGMKVLEIGMGSGYQASVLAYMTDLVYTIEIKANLFNLTDAIYKKYEADYPALRNVRRMNADGYYGWEEHAPFDRIIVTCGIDHIPPALLKQLKPDGIMVIPIGPMNGEQVILKITKRVDAEGVTTLEREDIYGGKVVQAFVPFTASDGSWHQKNK